MALGFALVLTPLAKRLGARLGAVNVPSERKVHTMPIPRVGGLAVFLAFAATMALTNLYVTRVSELFVFDHRTAFGFYGALVVFGCGLWDDFRRLNPWIKLLFQILGATLAFAGGVVFFTSLLMIILSVMRADYLSAIYFAALGGVVLGFLRYNFNPVIVFLGDGGSYFLGYAVAALSIMGSVKSQVGALMLIPLLALGVPVFDTILSPVRRFVRGRRTFLALQMEANRTRTLEELWAYVGEALEMLKFDRAVLHVGTAPHFPSEKRAQAPIFRHSCTVCRIFVDILCRIMLYPSCNS